MINIFFCRFVDRADRFLIRRVDGLKGFAIYALDELIVDEATLSDWSAFGLHLFAWGDCGGGRMTTSDKSGVGRTMK